MSGISRTRLPKSKFRANMYLHYPITLPPHRRLDFTAVGEHIGFDGPKGESCDGPRWNMRSALWKIIYSTALTVWSTRSKSKIIILPLTLSPTLLNPCLSACVARYASGEMSRIGAPEGFRPRSSRSRRCLGICLDERRRSLVLFGRNLNLHTPHGLDEDPLRSKILAKASAPLPQPTALKFMRSRGRAMFQVGDKLFPVNLLWEFFSNVQCTPFVGCKTWNYFVPGVLYVDSRTNDGRPHLPTADQRPLHEERVFSLCFGLSPARTLFELMLSRLPYLLSRPQEPFPRDGNRILTRKADGYCTRG